MGEGRSHPPDPIMALTGRCKTGRLRLADPGGSPGAVTAVGQRTVLPGTAAARQLDN